MATIGLQGELGLDFSKLMAKGKDLVQTEGKKALLNTAAEQINKELNKGQKAGPALTSTASERLDAIVAKSGMPKWALAAGAVCLIGAIGFLLFYKPKPKELAKAAAKEEKELLQAQGV
jgi:hypothetical protein